MPEKETLERARADKRGGKPASTQAGEFVREEMHHIRRGKARRGEQAAGHCYRAIQGAARGGGTGTAG
jgi:hypothetical protein